MSTRRLAQAATDESFRLGEWQVDPALNQISRGQIARDQETVRLEPRTMRLLTRLAETPGQVVSSRELLDTVWAGVVVGPASVYQAISQLRKLLGDTDPVPTFIATIPRKGYRLVAPVQRGASVVEHPPAPTSDLTSSLSALAISSPEMSCQAIASPAKRPPAYLFWGIAALLMLTLGIVIAVAIREPQRQTAEIPAPTATLDSRAIAIAPFEPTTEDEPTQTLAPIVTDLLRTRLAALQNLVVVASGSITNAIQTEPNLSAVARKVHARYLLQGDVRRAQDQVRMNVTLVDIETDSPLWSMTFDRPVEQIATINEEIVEQAAKSLQIVLEPASSNASADVPSDLSTYELYLRGQQLMATFRAAETEQAIFIFSRVTTLDPSFARGYYSLGQALLLAADLGARMMTKELAKQAGQAFDRAIDLNPALGPAWAQRARLTSDPVEAEKLYRRALQLAPSYDENYIRYSDFLFSQGRRGEALDLIDRARRIDPLSTPLYWRKAQLLLATRGDVAGMEQLLQEALAIKPDFPTAIRELGKSKFLWHGDFAEAVQLMERAAAIDPDSRYGNALVFELYLAMGDLPAAMALLHNTEEPVKQAEREMLASLALYQRDIKRAAEVARGVMRDWLLPESSIHLITDDLRVHAVHHELASWYWVTAIALRDEAMLTGNFAPALDLIERTTLLFSGTSPMRNRGLVLTYAHVLLLSGETRRGRELLTSLLEHLDAEQIGRPANMYAWERAAAFAMLGEDERALTELTASQKMGRFAGWWYTAELDPVYARVRHDPRFQALAARARAHSREQRALLEGMRRNAKVSKRT
jgi:DNA-binding winged helix-turn-helix (wHTH) protein/TolB-like protein/Tfp pilus assembly protein PilF